MRLGTIALCVLASACATPAMSPANLAPDANFTAAPACRLAAPVTIKASAAGNQTLRADTTWMRVGSIAHGDVFHTKDQIVIIDSFNVFEADIVVKDGKVVGYFIPVGSRFVVAQPVAINLAIKDPQ